MSCAPTPLISADAQLRQRSFLSQVYIWMTAGLLVSSAVASYAASAPVVLNLLYGNPFTIWLLDTIHNKTTKLAFATSRWAKPPFNMHGWFAASESQTALL